MTSTMTAPRVHARPPRAYAPLPVAFDAHDGRRLALALPRAEGAARADLGDLLPAVGPFAQATLRRSCADAHHALLLFPTTVAAALDHVSARGLDPVEPIASGLVRERLCARYGLALDACEVSLTHLRTPSPAAGRHLDVFLFPRTAPALRAQIVDREREHRFEDHVAFEVGRPDEPTLERLVTLLQDDAGLVFECGEHNPHEGWGGGTVLYFVAETGRLRRPGDERVRRVELCCAGDFSALAIVAAPIFARRPTRTRAAPTRNSRRPRSSPSARRSGEPMPPTPGTCPHAATERPRPSEEPARARAFDAHDRVDLVHASPRPAARLTRSAPAHAGRDRRHRPRRTATRQHPDRRRSRRRASQPTRPRASPSTTARSPAGARAHRIRCITTGCSALLSM